MSHEEFCNCHTIDYRDLYEIEEELEIKNISNLFGKINYIKENYGGQMRMYYV